MTLYLQALLGIVVFIALVLPMSRNIRRINWKLVGIAVVLQFVICLLLLKAPFVKEGLLYLNQAVGALGAATLKGSSFVFGHLGGGDTPFTVTNPNAVVTFAFQVLPLVIVMSALSALLWYWRILPVIIRGISWLFERALGTRGPAGLVATANIFLGQTEAPLLVRPYLERMSRYELLLVMTAGMATIAGSVMVIYSAMLGAQFEGVLGHLITKSIMSVPAGSPRASASAPTRDISDRVGIFMPRSPRNMRTRRSLACWSTRHSSSPSSTSANWPRSWTTWMSRYSATAYGPTSSGASSRAVDSCSPGPTTSSNSRPSATAAPRRRWWSGSAKTVGWRPRAPRSRSAATIATYPYAGGISATRSRPAWPEIPAELKDRAGSLAQILLLRK